MRKLLLIITVLNSFFAFSQESDFGIWTGAGLKLEFKKDFQFKYAQQIRLQNNATQLDQWYNEVELSYQPIKYYKITGGNRFTLKENKEIKNRFYLQNSVQYKWNDSEVSYRLGFQAEFEPNKPNDFALRHKFAYEYKINKHWKPSASAEFFYGINYKEKEWYRYRLSVGMDYNPKKKHTLIPEFMFQQQLNAENPLNEFVTKITYEYAF